MRDLVKKQRRLPAEWEEQDAVVLAWPNDGMDWAPVISMVEPVFAEIIAAISRFEPVILIASDDGTARKKLTDAGADLEKITFVDIPTNDTWARDFGPITVYEREMPLILDFGFNGWGLKFPANLDNRINGRLSEKGLFRSLPVTIPFILEGGSIESDGDGALLVTSQCLLEKNRNPHLCKPAIEAMLAEQLGADKILWLDHGYLSGDDTDSHIDTLARLCPDDTILYVSCDDPADEHFTELTAMRQELETFRTKSGDPYRLVALPLPAPCFGLEGERIPATYANFLIINGAVLVPTYSDARDEEVLAVFRNVFPDREIIGIDCRSIIIQHGSLHCLTMQLPKGVLR